MSITASEVLSFMLLAITKQSAYSVKYVSLSDATDVNTKDYMTFLVTDLGCLYHHELVTYLSLTAFLKLISLKVAALYSAFARENCTYL